LIGYDLLDYVNGDIPCPSTDLSFNANPNKTHWVRQDKLILSAILASTSPKITPLIATAKTSQQAWQKLHTLYARGVHCPVRSGFNQKIQPNRKIILFINTTRTEPRTGSNRTGFVRFGLVF